jgi:rfaE bifunctional protein nucleotidyltransferase chain/domain/rfaE bifunctional protein kinase chain/domain
MTAAGRPLVVVGDALLDRDLDGTVERLCPDAPVPVVDQPVERARPGGAALAAALGASDGRPVSLVTALGDDAAGRELSRLLNESGVEVVDIGLDGATPEKVRVRAAGRSLLRLDYGAASAPPGPLHRAARAALEGAAALLVADYGRGMAAAPEIRNVLANRRPRVPLVWDPHPKGPRPVDGATLATPNRDEAGRLSGLPAGSGLSPVVAQARALAEQWRTAIAVTLGARGALLVHGDSPPLAVPAPPADGGDPCGAGDRFASAAAGALADGALPSEAVVAAVHAASAFVASGGAASFDPAPARSGAGARGRAREVGAFAVAAAVKARGGTVVATGGCFDLLHAGHAATLEAARALGDCLIVCLNSDGSVRRLKGDGRPMVPASDRARLLEALGCVDAVLTFDDDTPEAVLAQLRPDVFVKGGDYGVAELPEARLLASWGGQAVIVPYLEGRSTTRLIEKANR